MTDWESDPELKALRADFVRSFAPREQVLAELLAEIRRANLARVKGDQGPGFEVLALAHGLAGTATTYGFIELGSFSGRIEDLLLSERGVDSERLLELGSELGRLLREAGATGLDVAPDPGVVAGIEDENPS